MKSSNQKTKKQKQSLDHDPEIKKLLDEVKQDLNPQVELDLDLDIDFDGLDSNESEIEKISSEVQSPEKAHKLYYGKLRKILRRYLPGGKEYKKERKLIYDQINLFLKDGSEKGRDSRQAYYHNFEKAITILIDWVNETGGKDPFELYSRFNSLNLELGHIKKDKS